MLNRGWVKGVEGLVAVGVGPVGSHLVTTAEHLEYGGSSTSKDGVGQKL